MCLYWGGRNIVEVCFLVSSSKPTVTRVTWNFGDESRLAESSWQWTHFDGVQHRYCFVSWSWDRPTTVRIEPVDHPIAFAFKGVVFESIGDLWPDEFLFNRPSGDQKYQLANDVIPNVQAASWVGTGPDPWFEYAVPSNDKLWLAVALSLILPALCYWVAVKVMLLSPYQAGASWLLSLFLGMLFWSWVLINREFFNWVPALSWLMPSVLVIQLVVSIIIIRLDFSIRRIYYGLLFLVATVPIVGDVAFRLGVWEKPAFMLNNNHKYHWSVHSISSHYPAPYEDYRADIQSISSLIDYPAAFLADLATSYYLPAFISIYPLNVHNHHSVQSASYREIYSLLCDGDSRGLDQLSKVVRSRDKELPSIRYLLHNRNVSDPNVGEGCPKQTFDQTIRAFDELEQIYDGEWLSVYEIRPE